jgi:hypothetical protein
MSKYNHKEYFSSKSELFWVTVDDLTEEEAKDELCKCMDLINSFISSVSKEMEDLRDAGFAAD